MILLLRRFLRVGQLWFTSFGLAMLLTGCGAATATVPRSALAVYSAQPVRTDFTVYDDPEIGYSIALPREWHIGQLPDPHRGIVVASSNDPSQQRGAITIVMEPAGVSANLEQASAVAERELRAGEGIGGFDVELARGATVNGQRAEERIYRYRLGAEELRHRSFYFLSGDRLFAISFAAPLELYAQYDTLFVDAISSWRQL
jgi:hypothetical protein